MPTFMHFEFSHLAIILILEVSIGTLLETIMGKIRFLIFFIVTALGSQIFAAAVSPYYSVGGDGVVFACIGGCFSVVAVYWPKIVAEECQKICLLFMMVLVLVVAIVLLTSESAMSGRYLTGYQISHPDFWSMFSGFLYGLFTAFWVLPQQLKDGNKWRTREVIFVSVGLIVTLVMTVICLAGLFKSAPEKYWRLDEEPTPKE